MRILLEDKDHRPVPIEKFTELDKDCIALMQKHKLRFLQHSEGCLVSDVTYLLQEEPGFTVDV